MKAHWAIPWYTEVTSVRRHWCHFREGSWETSHWLRPHIFRHGRDIGTIGFVPSQLLEVSDVSSIWEFEQICRQTLMLIANQKNRRLGRIIKYTIAYTYHNGEKLDNVYPICSMYGIFIFTYIWVIFMAHVGKYSSTMEHMGILYMYIDILS